MTSTSPEFPIWLRSYYVKHSILAYLILSLYCIILSPFFFFGLLATAPASEGTALAYCLQKATCSAVPLYHRQGLEVLEFA